jgi:hypothetical protein
MADTNQLYQNVAQSAQDVKNTYAGLPTFETNIRENLVAPDVTLNSALGGYTDKVAELFAHDKQIADNWSTSQVPTNLQPEGFMEDPYAKSMASASLYAQKGKETASALNLYETRKNFLGNIVDKALKVYEAGIKGKEMDYQAAKDEFDNALKLAQLEETKRSNLAGEDIARGNKSGIGITGDPEVDSLDNSTIKTLYANIYGANSYQKLGGTETDRIDLARAALANYNKTGKIDYQYLRDTLGDTKNNTLDALTDIITRANDLTSTLESGQNITGPLIGRTSKIGADIFGKSGIASMTGKELEEMSADKIKERYGGALTATEVQRLTKQAITGRNIQEASNLESLAIMKKNAISLIRAKLGGIWSEAQIEGYIQSLESDQGTWEDTGNTK